MSFKSKLINDLKVITGDRYIITAKWNKQQYSKGWRYGEGDALAVAKPGTLLEIWKILQICVQADVIVIMQAANTGLTGGSTPDGDDYDRPIVIISTMRIDNIQIIDQGKQIIGFSGSTLFGLENKLAPYGREPHSVIGSSCIGASIVGGVCNNSGGALVKRGPAYTELSIYAQINLKGELEIVNDLGIELGDTPEDILTNLQEAINNGTPYLGTSAGSNICGVNMKNTNDMPIVYPPSFTTLGCIHFNINAHYLDPIAGSTHMGETRETRIKEFHVFNDTPVLGLREGSWLEVNGNAIFLKGKLTARFFEKNKQPIELISGGLIK